MNRLVVFLVFALALSVPTATCALNSEDAIQTPDLPSTEERTTDVDTQTLRVSCVVCPQIVPTCSNCSTTCRVHARTCKKCARAECVAPTPAVAVQTPELTEERTTDVGTNSLKLSCVVCPKFIPTCSNCSTTCRVHSRTCKKCARAECVAPTPAVAVQTPELTEETTTDVDTLALRLRLSCVVCPEFIPTCSNCSTTCRVHRQTCKKCARAECIVSSTTSSTPAVALQTPDLEVADETDTASTASTDSSSAGTVANSTASRCAVCTLDLPTCATDCTQSGRVCTVVPRTCDRCASASCCVECPQAIPTCKSCPRTIGRCVVIAQSCGKCAKAKCVPNLTPFGG